MADNKDKKELVCCVCQAGPARLCTGCGIKAYAKAYCGAKCQKVHWPKHKLVCRLAPLSHSLVIRDSGRGIGLGVFSSSADIKEWSIIGTDHVKSRADPAPTACACCACWFSRVGSNLGMFVQAVLGVYGQGGLGVPDMTLTLVRSRPDPLQWLKSHGFTEPRKYLPPMAHVHIKDIAERTKTSDHVVQMVMRILYQYEFTHTHLDVSDGVGLYRFASMINHSCDPNVMWICGSAGECHLLAVKPILAGEQLFVSYRAATVVDSYRHVAIQSLYDIFNGNLCRCESFECVHRGLSVLNVLDAHPSLNIWTVPFESGNLTAILDQIVKDKVCCTVDQQLVNNGWQPLQPWLNQLDNTGWQPVTNQLEWFNDAKNRIIQLLVLLSHTIGPVTAKNQKPGAWLKSCMAAANLSIDQTKELLLWCIELVGLTTSNPEALISLGIIQLQINLGDQKHYILPFDLLGFLQ